MDQITSQEQFDKQSQHYADSPLHREGPSLPVMLEYAAPQAPDIVLDIATGTGNAAMTMAPHAAKVVGIDLSEQMLKEARRLASEAGLTTVEFQMGDAENIPFADFTFDLVTARHAPHHFLNVAAFLQEVRRVLKPGGRFVMVDQISPSAVVKGWCNSWEQTRDPSHFLQRTVEEWMELAHQTGLQWSRHTLVPYRMEFDEWVHRAGTSEKSIETLRALARSASQAEREAVLLEFEGDQVTAFTDQMLVVRMEPAPSS